MCLETQLLVAFLGSSDHQRQLVNSLQSVFSKRSERVTSGWLPLLGDGQRLYQVAKFSDGFLLESGVSRGRESSNHQSQRMSGTERKRKFFFAARITYAYISEGGELACRIGTVLPCQWWAYISVSSQYKRAALACIQWPLADKGFLLQDQWIMRFRLRKDEAKGNDYKYKEQVFKTKK